MSLMNILGIDPGPLQSALALWDTDAEEVLDHQYIHNDAAVEYISDFASPLCEFQLDVLCIEFIQSYGMAVGQETFGTCLYCGDYRRTGLNMQVDTSLVFKTTWAAGLTGSANANKSQTRRAVIDRYGYWKHGSTGLGVKAHPGKLYGITAHIWDALGIAIYAMEQYAAGKRPVERWKDYQLREAKSKRKAKKKERK